MYKIAAFVFCVLLWQSFAQAQNQPVRPEAGTTGTVAKVQQEVTLSIKALDAAGKQVLRQYSYRTSLPDSAAARKEVQALVHRLQQDSYLLASADTLSFSGNTLHVKLHVGQPFKWARLRNGNLSEGILVESGFREKFYLGAPFEPAEYVKLQQRILDYAERNGYPFASVWLDSIRIEGNQIEAALLVEKAFLVTYDSLEVVGETKTQQKFLMRYLQLLPGQPYNQDQIDASQRMLSQLPYVKVTRAPQVRFVRDKAKVYYFLEDRQANQVDGVVGFLPNPTRSDKLLVTGEANLNIRNIKGTGKQLGLQWRRVNKGSVILNGEYLHPNLLGTPFELGAKFNLLKQDSSFITVQPRLQLAYYTLQYGKFSVFTEWRNSRTLSSANVQSLQRLDLADAQTNTYGLNYLWNNLDDFYFPRRGRLVELQVAAGNKKLLRSPGLEKSFYETLQLKTTQLSLGVRVESFFRLGQNSALLARLRGEALLNDQIFLNDMYRIGGLSSLRGFDDYFFYASSYGVGTLEYRLFTAADSYVLLFYDQAYYRSDLEKVKASGYPLGLGGGISFSTGAGIFQLVYSLGKSEQQPLSFKYSKIHFGITSKF
ncbi:surface antigen-like variable number repeat protein [Pontibacter ummariensis]|uniref:Surface antigen variable number repeat-containing protein n=1 Tax=Pontibacter ummariensis TaxID=1610492 RepID=A0A239CR10_9BACT|nr:POTRA domain-containing protein [Pontibacter ummariensis]PRY14903.1 surface antigen-like variable number repeat protein [Pontibacter ummariensis]SNS21934.1 Surface antigen variable number repeat-containing protein [Pontibacter ummariensis]